MAKADIYVSIDIEADGPIPGPHSLLSLGAAAFREGVARPFATFEINFSPLPDAAPHPDTLAWWKEQDPAVWAHVTAEPKDPKDAVAALVRWVKALPGSPVLVTYPSWDYLWVHWYCQRFYGSSPFGLGGLDVKSYAFAVLDPAVFKEATKRRMPTELFLDADGQVPPHTHRALDDAIGQGVLFINLLARRRAGGA